MMGDLPHKNSAPLCSRNSISICLSWTSARNPTWSCQGCGFWVPQPLLAQALGLVGPIGFHPLSRERAKKRKRHLRFFFLRNLTAGLCSLDTGRSNQPLQLTEVSLYSRYWCWVRKQLSWADLSGNPVTVLCGSYIPLACSAKVIPCRWWHQSSSKDFKNQWELMETTSNHQRHGLGTKQMLLSPAFRQFERVIGRAWSTEIWLKCQSLETQITL